MSFKSTGDREGGIKAGLKHILARKKERLANGKFNCPLCREVFTGIRALGVHLKQHCT
ncbi:MAG: hypothetical protein ISR96_06195 [Nitrospira sp.]|nr:hypothetical protein [bacterium]MBL7049086.1 hypothetical protein [Nitrospira sp.]